MASSKKKPAKQIDIDPEDEVIEIEEGDEVDDIALVDDLDPDLDPDDLAEELEDDPECIGNCELVEEIISTDSLKDESN